MTKSELAISKEDLLKSGVSNDDATIELMLDKLLVLVKEGKLDNARDELWSIIDGMIDVDMVINNKSRWTKRDFKLKGIYKGKNNRKDYTFHTSKEANVILSEKYGKNIFSIPLVMYAKAEDVVAIQKILRSSEKVTTEIVDDEELRVILKELSEEVVDEYE